MNGFKKILKSPAKCLGVVMIVIVIVFCGYLFGSQREQHNLRSFCNSIKFGTLLSSLPQLAIQNGVDPALIPNQGIPTPRGFVLVVPAISKPEQTGCVITYGGDIIGSAGMNH